jgi:hypothetical protein
MWKKMTYELFRLRNIICHLYVAKKKLKSLGILTLSFLEEHFKTSFHLLLGKKGS